MAGSREQGAWGMELAVSSQQSQHKAWSLELGAWSLGHGAGSMGKEVNSQQLAVSSQLD